MAIFEITKDEIAFLPQTTFAAQRIRERYYLQRLLRDHINVVASDTYVLAEEYCEWEEGRRRIDLLCLDKEANLVVVELKRTEEGGHMELQAIRYAAMVHLMTYDLAVATHARYLKSINKEEDAESAILRFLKWNQPHKDKFAQDTRIFLVSADFSKEITTSVMWLNERDLDIRCVRLLPYSLGERTLLDIQQVIPLPEANEYQVQLRKKTAEERQSQQSGADWTRYDLRIKGIEYPNLYKRRLFFLVVQAMIKAGVSPGEMGEFFPERKFLGVPGKCNADEFQEKVNKLTNSTGGSYDLGRYYAADDELFFVDGSTYALSNQWSKSRLPALDKMIEKYPQAGVSYKEAASNEGD